MHSTLDETIEHAFVKGAGDRPCRGGISHNPAEHVGPDDADAGAGALLRLIENFRARGQTTEAGGAGQA